MCRVGLIAEWQEIEAKVCSSKVENMMNCRVTEWRRKHAFREEDNMGVLRPFDFLFVKRDWLICRFGKERRCEDWSRNRHS